ncbi:MAG: hypothetical protein KKA07_12385, partial [Bacteroidetes bacterium]|nr:hypothetical protein [Bacteroidota bacterium]
MRVSKSVYFPLKALTRWLLFVAFIVFIGFSCKTKQKISKDPLKENGADYLFGKLKENELKYEWLRIKFSANFKSERKSNSFMGHVRI